MLGQLESQLLSQSASVPKVLLDTGLHCVVQLDKLLLQLAFVLARNHVDGCHQEQVLLNVLEEVNESLVFSRVHLVQFCVELFDSVDYFLALLSDEFVVEVVVGLIIRMVSL